jgi:hypothetical protein
MVTAVTSPHPDPRAILDGKHSGRAVVVGARLKRYIATIVCKPGTAQETTRDHAEILAADDDEAVRQAREWLRRSGLAQAGDFLIVAENGRSVRSIEIKIP